MMRTIILRDALDGYIGELKGDELKNCIDYPDIIRYKRKYYTLTMVNNKHVWYRLAQVTEVKGKLEKK